MPERQDYPYFKGDSILLAFVVETAATGRPDSMTCNIREDADGNTLVTSLTSAAGEITLTELADGSGYGITVNIPKAKADLLEIGTKYLAAVTRIFDGPPETRQTTGTFVLIPQYNPNVDDPA